MEWERQNRVWIASVKVTLVIPVYNEKGRLQGVLEKLQAFHEVIVIDDHSHEAVVNYIDTKQYPNVTFFRNEKNLGYIESIKRGIQKASNEIIVTMDADGEHKPEDIKKLIAPLEEDKCDIVYGKRPNIARWSEILLLRMTGIFTGEKLFDAGTGFRAIKAEYAKKLKFVGKCTCGMLHLECYQNNMRSCEVTVDLPVINKARRIAWEHFRQFFILISYMIKFWLFRIKI